MREVSFLKKVVGVVQKRTRGSSHGEQMIREGRRGAGETRSKATSKQFFPFLPHTDRHRRDRHPRVVYSRRAISGQKARRVAERAMLLMLAPTEGKAARERSSQVLCECEFNFASAAGRGVEQV